MGIFDKPKSALSLIKDMSTDAGVAKRIKQALWDSRRKQEQEDDRRHQKEAEEEIRSWWGGKKSSNDNDKK